MLDGLPTLLLANDPRMGSRPFRGRYGSAGSAIACTICICQLATAAIVNILLLSEHFSSSKRSHMGGYLMATGIRPLLLKQFDQSFNRFRGISEEPSMRW